jgi:hypothetical protein
MSEPTHYRPKRTAAAEPADAIGEPTAACVTGVADGRA